MSTRFKDAITQLVTEIESLRTSIGPLNTSMEMEEQINHYLLGQFLEKHGTVKEIVSEKERKYQVPPTHSGQMRRYLKRMASARIAKELLPSSLLVTLVSRYDAYLGRLVRAMVLTRPELMNSSERTLKFSSLMALQTFDSARDFLIEKEIESVLRESHSSQFDWLEKKLNITLRKDLPSWDTFLEITERRNLFVHCDGVVSHQYIATCGSESCTIGEKLSVSPEYFQEASDCILEISVKLIHVIWRKLCPDDIEDADNALNAICFELLQNDEFATANELLRFATQTLKKHANERSRLMFLINLAQSYKWLGKDEDCVRVLASEDWSAKGADFNLCVSVLHEQYDEAGVLMRLMGTSGDIDSQAYREWPIFRKARKELKFQDAYKAVFSEEMLAERSVSMSDTVGKEDVIGFLKSLLKKIDDSNERAK